ncbi:MAG TPA: hypothetical protein VIU41_13370 [Geobacteraceae bacterium]
MKSILVISNDQRSDDLIRQFQPLLKRHIGSVTDFDQGLKKVFDKRPAVVFIQSEIGGISGDAVARHIRELLRDDSPKLVLMRDAPDKEFASRDTFDDNIDLFASNEELFTQFKAKLEKVPALQWCEPVTEAGGPVEAALVQVEVGAAGETLVPTRMSPSPDLRPAQSAEGATSAGNVPRQAPRDSMSPLSTGPSLAVSPEDVPGDLEMAAPDIAVDRPRRRGDNHRRPWLYLGGVLITCIAGMAIFVGVRHWIERSVSDSGPVVAPAKAVAASSAKKAAPGSIGRHPSE